VDASIGGLNQELSGEKLAQVAAEGLPVEGNPLGESLESNAGRWHGSIEQDPSRMGKGGEDSEGVPDRTFVLGEFFSEGGQQITRESFGILGWGVLHGATPAFHLQEPP